jgi:glycosyltransferase involved in cell wall biosynthesis
VNIRRVYNVDKLYMVIPAYNEEANIEDVVKQWYPIIERHNGNGESRLVVIDDGSKDSTYAILEKLSTERPLLKAITKTNAGHGATVLYGYNYALDNKADYIFQTDSDGQTLPSEFEAFWKCRKDYDMVIGHRNNRKDGISRIIVTKVLKLVIRCFFHVRVKDANTPYRLMKADKLKECVLIIPKDYFLSNVLVSVIFTKKKWKVKYIPITFRQRQGGKNSINLPRIFKIGRESCASFIKLNKKISK